MEVNKMNNATCTTGKCDTGANMNKGFFTVACSNEQCNFKRKPETVDIDKWNINATYRDEVDNCPQCNNILYLTPRTRKTGTRTHISHNVNTAQLKTNANSQDKHKRIALSIKTNEPKGNFLQNSHKKPYPQRHEPTQKVKPTGATNK